jgi:hypothetical protein
MIKLLSFKKNAVWVWSFKLNEEEHSLRLQESNVSGKRVITLDDKPILEIAPKFLDVGSEHRR